LLISVRSSSTTLLILLATLFISTAAIAEVDCETLVNGLALESQTDAQQLASLRELETSCSTNSRYYAIAGLLELRTGAVDRSVLSLERAVMLDPLNGEAMVDYAVALNATGQHRLALRVVQSLLSQPNMPNDLNRRLVEFEGLLQSKIASRQSAKPDRAVAPPTSIAKTDTQPLRSTLRLQTGYGSNLNAGSSAELIELEISGETLALNLPPDYRPQSGLFSEIGYQAAVPTADSARQLLLFANHRVAEVENYESADLGATQRYLLKEDSPFGWVDARALLHRSQGEVNPILSLTAAFAGDRLALVDELSLNLERNFASKNSTARKAQVGLVAIRKFSVGRAQGQLQATVNLMEYDGSYWGGKRISSSLGLRLARQVDKVEFWSSLRGYRERDSKGFSELLDSNRPLTVTGLAVALGGSVKIDSNSRINVQLRNISESSNIDLYENRASFFRLGYSYSW